MSVHHRHHLSIDVHVFYRLLHHVLLLNKLVLLLRLWLKLVLGSELRGLCWYLLVLLALLLVLAVVLVEEGNVASGHPLAAGHFLVREHGDLFLGLHDFKFLFL